MFHSSTPKTASFLTTDFHGFHVELAEFNRRRLEPLTEDPFWRVSLARNADLQLREAEFMETSREEIAPLLSGMPRDPDGFMRWFEALRETGPGQNDPLFPWLANHATLAQMRWFLTQEVAGEAGFEDLVALAQIKMPTRPKLEMARNYWDEMGRGGEKGMHGPMLGRLADDLDLAPARDCTVAEAIALGNVMTALACNRRYAFHAVGALGAIEMTAPGRAAYVYQGLRRLGVSEKASQYFKLHSILDVKHSEAWNTEVIRPLIAEDHRRARSIGEGAILRLSCGEACFERYRTEFNIPVEGGLPRLTAAAA